MPLSCESDDIALGRLLMPAMALRVNLRGTSQSSRWMSASSASEAIVGANFSRTRSVPSVNGVRAIFSPGDHVIRLFGQSLFHTRRADRHACHADPGQRGPLTEQSLNVFRGNVSFDDVAVHDGCVARAERIWDAVLILHRRHVGRVPLTDFKPGRLQSLYPRLTAASGGVLVNGDCGVVLAG